MQTITEMLGTYAAYHRDARNRLTHYFGIPLITFSILILLSLLRFPLGTFTVSSADILVAIIIIWYLRLDLPLGLISLAFILPALFVADDMAATRPTAYVMWWFWSLFVTGWVLQLLGHYYEGRKPALSDNFIQIFSGPLFVVTELVFAFGLRSNLHSGIQQVSNRVDSELRAASR
jgi:uncharacterized membrane protein YGL010W